jgi:hypothetical protein
MNEFIFCTFKTKEEIFRFTYNEFTDKPFGITINNNIKIHCDEETFGQLVTIVVENMEDSE